MCKGVQEEKTNKRKHSFCSLKEESVSVGYVSCELCSDRASLYCQADDAFLCGKCDKKVHQANFLAMRHVRCFLCNTCQNLTRRLLVGASTEVLVPVGVELVERRSRRCNNNNNDNDSMVERKSPGRTKRPFHQFL